MQNLNTNEAIDPEAKREAWFKIIEDYHRCGQSQVGYCRAHNINKDHFGYYLSKWRAKHADTVKPVSFMQMQVVDASSSDKWILKVTSDVNLEIPANTPMHKLAELLHNLRAKA